VNALQYIMAFKRSGAGGPITDGLVLRNQFNDMANLSLTFPSNGSAEFNGTSDYIETPLLNDYSGYTGLTISTWMYSGDLTSNKTIASNWGDNDNNNFGWLIFTGQFVDYQFKRKSMVLRYLRLGKRKRENIH
jgi:hypothetical protein